MREIMEAMPEDSIRWRLEIEWNARMLRCAEKLGFTEVNRTKAAYTVHGREYDALVLEKREGGD